MKRYITILIWTLLGAIAVQGQIKIGGNVYGGGNHGNVEGSANVRVCAGDITKVFGGARMANVGGRTFVNIDGEHATDNVMISEVYGGNDVAGTIGQSGEETTVPTELENVLPAISDGDIAASGKTREEYIKATYPKKNAIDNTWKTFVATSRSTKTEGGKTMEDKWLTIGSLFGGGNGDFNYTDEDGNPLTDASGNYIVTEDKTIDGIPTTITVATNTSPFTLPNIDKTYLEVKGGNIAHVYGGGNNVTVRENTTINIDNTSDDCQGYVTQKVGELMASDADIGEGVAHTVANYTAYTINALKEMSGLRTFQSDITSFNFNHARVFGGNNKAPMAIRPKWNLQQGMIRDLYSGGNRGNMTSPEGLLVEIEPAEKNTSGAEDPDKNDKDLSIQNVFGGCRMADVKPTVNGEYTPCPNLQDKDSEGNLIYHFPTELSARLLVRGGLITNVYGGNDITGTVYGGNAVGIYTNIKGDVYGGGNGAYAYTDQSDSENHEDYSDFYYSTEDYGSSIEALNAHRPNAEQVSIRLAGTDAAHPTIIKGSVFVGGNCASLATVKSKPMVELKIGSHVIADQVYLGNNGEKMVSPDILALYKDDEYSSLDLINDNTFADYMLGAAMDLQPSVVFDNEANGDPATYVPYTSYVGSFFCGGNRGSMIIPGKNTYKIDKGLYIFNKFVGGCNNAYVDEVWTGANKTGDQLCTRYEGGILGSAAEQDDYTDASGKIKDRLEINLENLTIMPQRWIDATKTGIKWNTQKWYDYALIEEGTVLDVDSKYYTYNSTTKEYTEHTVTGSAHTVAAGDNYYEAIFDFVECERNAADTDIRLVGGNVYGGCYNSGHVNGNVTINIKENLLKKDEVFIKKENVENASDPTSGVQLEKQRDDVMAVAMTVFGAGCGVDTEIWGSTKVNLNKGYAFQIFGGGEEGVVGRKRDIKDEHGVVTGEEYYFDPAFSSTVNLNGASPIYSSEEKDDDLAETEFIYGGGNEGNVSGNTYVNLGNGRIYDAFGGASDADILGHTEVYIGRQPNGSGGYKDGFPWIKDIVYGGNDFGGTIYGEYVTDYDYVSRIRDFATDGASLHGSPTNENPGVLKSASYVEYLQGRVDTIFGGNYGYYDYSLEKFEDDEGNKAKMPYLSNSFVNIRPKHNGNNQITGIFGGGTGYPKSREGDKSQDRSYVLIDIPKNGDEDVEYFKNVEVFGSGSYNGLGMRFNKAATFADSFDLDSLSAIVDLMHGKIKAVYGGSYNEGITARTVINVPATSTIYIDSIFGGAYGTQILPPCDVYESNVNYDGEGATVTGAIYGGNNNERRTLYSKVNVTAPVWSNRTKGYCATVYGAGHGIDTWSEYTEVNLLPKPEGVAGDYTGARVYEVYGGGEMGHVLNAESMQKYMQTYKNGPSNQIATDDSFWKDSSKWTLTDGIHVPNTDELKAQWEADWKDAWTLGDYYTPTDKDGSGKYTYTDYATNGNTNLTNTALVTHDADMDDRDYSAYAYSVADDANAKAAKDAAKQRIFKRYNTNVRIHEGATVEGYAYGGGLGDSKVGLTGDVYGTTYIGLLGGTVVKDIYAAGTTGAVYDLFGVGSYNASTNTSGFTASANAYVKGGSCRNVYGGGWKGDVGHHAGAINASTATDVLGETHVVIGDAGGSSFVNGIPTVQRNAYGGGEGGAVYGVAHLTMNNGYIGYQYNSDSKQYEEKIEDDTKATPNTFLQDAGCMFGGGYIDNSVVDKTMVKLYNGHVRGSIFGGGEIAAIGRGSISKTTSGGKTTYSLEGIYRPGKTNIEMFGGQVHRNVYGGGRGTDNLGGHGSLNCDGFIFGQTEVHIHGGEIGTVSGLADGNGNVFGAGDEGFVYSAYENADGTFARGVKPTGSERYKDDYQGYYYKHKWYGDASTGSNIDSEGFYTEDVTINGVTTKERMLTEDCKVLIEPHMRVKTAVTINGTSYKVGDYVPISDLNTLGNKSTDADTWECLDDTGIIIHNAVFAGGNIPSGSLTTGANTATVFGNATASVNDIFHRDMITLGTRHTGGLYGDGNLTLVDGYRELNITNYGTDYYSIAKQIDIDAYHALPDREADYYELRYTCKKSCQDKDGTQYKEATTDANGFTTKASTITADEMQSLFVEEKNGKKVSVVAENGDSILAYDTVKGEWIPNPKLAEPYWEESGVLPVYAGRLMNSIQRADLCGVWGSRMVMQGAQDRVPDEVDFTNYTINRVREVSLNKKTISGVDHGNYFGIYNIVNYLGALTSDVDFGDETSGTVRATDNSDAATYKCDAGTGGKAYGTATYYDWKKAFHAERKRNNGSSHNKVALASGVYLELTSEESTGDGLYEKVWGPITGVIELDLINVSTGIGGGFVYAKNQHGVRTRTPHKNTTLTALNAGAVTQWDYTYSTTETSTYQKEFETSGNFVHSTQTIIDDCYNISNRYMGEGKMPAHYWYIKGSTYVYDQYISAYTGASNAFSETVDIPLTIAAASHGKMKLLNVQPNLYAYYSSPGVKLGEGKKVIINDKTYYKNDPISYWDWYLLSKSEKDLFVPTTYVNCLTYYDNNNVEYEAGTYVMTDAEFATYKNSSHTYKDAEGNIIKTADNRDADDDYIFRLSNNVSHGSGYILTYEVNNPSLWDNWFTLKNGDYKLKKTLEQYEAMDVATRATYYDGPTYRLKSQYSSGMLLGQRSYKLGELISKSIYDTYTAIPAAAIPNHNLSEGEEGYDADKKQAVFEVAYIVPSKITVTEGDAERHYNEGAAVPQSFATAHSIATEGNKAYISTSTFQITKDEVIYKDSKMTKKEADAYIAGVESRMDDIKSGAGAMTIDQIKALATSGEGAITVENKKALTDLATLRDDLKVSLVPAYYCSTGGLYGGNYFESGKNYRGLEAWSSLSSTDHDKFDYNYDALDLLIDPDYKNPKTGPNSEGQKFLYDGAYTSEDQVRDEDDGNPAGYSVTQSVDYTASYNGTELKLGKGNLVPITRNGAIVNDSIIKKDDELAREVYEDSLVNEQRHYAPISVTANGTYYVVNTAFQIGSTPYAAGETISSETFSGLPKDEQQFITKLEFTGITSENAQTYYYCRDSYTVESGGTSVSNATNVTAKNGSTDAACTVTGTYNANATVPLGLVIPSTTYGDLKNQQRNFTIHGISPTETSTLFVSHESNIYDLSKEKIITVIYQYDYDETDGSGNVTPISERHVLNIHLSFKSGVPTVADISEPDIILPGDFTLLREPTVTPGAYEVTGGGWELFESQRDAESHSNGIDYEPGEDPLYWYQDGHFVAYYAKSFAGRTYSNYVPVKVANYHDLAEVMSVENKDHHMYIDNKNVKREPKIYINDYSASGKNGLDLFKALYDLSLVTEASTAGTDGYTVADGKITAATGTANTALVGHALLTTQTRAERNLEFFMRTDINHTGTWTPIGYDGVCDDPETKDVDEGVAGKCFDGVLHGDGYTISGLDHSLFDHLCGEVYNLGVTGSFTGAGIAEQGGGYVESCWVKTTGTPDATSTTGVRAVFGNPSAASGFKQIVNSYCQSDKTYNTTDTDSHGLATPMPEQAYYNGTLAYNLNNFYLYKRYSDHTALSGSPAEYKYWQSGEADLKTAYYASHPDLCSSGYNNIKYVEGRFKDGDFRFAVGNTSGIDDERHWTETVTSGGTTTDEDRWSPIWPDDYIFFGQKLTYGYNAYAHQDVPTAVVRDGGHLSLNDDANRVYRAPAYFRSKDMGVAYFNPRAYLAQKSKDGTKEAYPSMTAIDFAGHNDTHEGTNGDKKAYELGLNSGKFYAPLLDDDGLTGITNCDETKNLLAYAPAEAANKATYDVLNRYFEEPAYSDYHDNTSAAYTDGKRYDRVADATGQVINGHVVQSNMTADKDQLLVDKEDFNAPFGYSFDSSHRMWYQRKPADKEYVDHDKGWTGISIPFTAELVTTNDKGEISHFYSGSSTSANSNKKIGHEYWLRELNDITIEPAAGGNPEVAKASFLYPTATGGNKTVNSTFLWDYYYSKNPATEGNAGRDANEDIYQTYYQRSRTYTSYPRLTGANPYIIGFPGLTYYEFDLSGNFTAQNTYASIDKLNKQIITFASSVGAVIGVSDDDVSTGAIKSKEGSSKTFTFTFKPSYMNMSLDAGTNNFTLNDDGNRYDKVPDTGDAVKVSAFRPYFIAESAASSRQITRSIIFANGYGDAEMSHENDNKDTLGIINVYAGHKKIVAVSGLTHETDVRITTVGGVTLADFIIQPGETIETRINNAGVYIVQTVGGKYTKKITVK